MKNNKIVFKKVGTNFQVTLPIKCREQWNLEAGSLIKMHMESNKLIIEQALDNKAETLAKIEKIFNELDKKPLLEANEESIMQVVSNEVKLSRVQ